MQIHDQIEFHNVAELVPMAHPAGLALYRYSREAISHLSTLGQHVGTCADGVELRFVTGTSWVNLTLSAISRYPWAAGAKVSIFRGDIPIAEHSIADGATSTIKLEAPAILDKMAPRAFADRLFSQDVWRIFLSGTTIVYHGIETGGQSIRPPRPDEKPALRWLAYGSSITNSVPGYVHHCARHLRADVFNKGLCEQRRVSPPICFYKLSTYIALVVQKTNWSTRPCLDRCASNIPAPAIMSSAGAMPGFPSSRRIPTKSFFWIAWFISRKSSGSKSGPTAS